jgi:Fe-S-cluster containining protein
MPARPSKARTCLQQQTDGWFQRASAALLGQLPCRAGCSHCCIGPFAITLLDVVTLQAGLKRLQPPLREEIERRAVEQTIAMSAAYPALAQSPFLDQWSDSDIDQLVGRFSSLPCPALGANGLCDLYEHRPLACRSMGIPNQERGLTHGACAVQTFVPIVRLPASFRAEEATLAHQETMAL